MSHMSRQRKDTVTSRPGRKTADFIVDLRSGRGGSFRAESYPGRGGTAFVALWLHDQEGVSQVDVEPDAFADFCARYLTGYHAERRDDDGSD